MIIQCVDLGPNVLYFGRLRSDQTVAVDLGGTCELLSYCVSPYHIL